MSDTKKSVGIVGGGLAGLFSALEIARQDAGQERTSHITVYEALSEPTETPQHTISLGESSWRTMRMMGTKEPQVIYDTFQEIMKLQELNGTELLRAQPTVFWCSPAEALVEGSTYPRYKETLVSYAQWLRDEMKHADVRLDSLVSEVSGAVLKQRFPGIYVTVPDDAMALVEEPYHPTANPHGVASDMNIHDILSELREHLVEAYDVKINYGSQVTELNDLPGTGVTLALKDGTTVHHDDVVVAPGAHVGDLLSQYGIRNSLDRVVVSQIDLHTLGEKLVAMNGDWKDFGTHAIARYTNGPAADLFDQTMEVLEDIADRVETAGGVLKEMHVVPFTKTGKDGIPGVSAEERQAGIISTVGSFYTDYIDVTDETGAAQSRPVLKYMLGSMTTPITGVDPSEEAALAFAPPTHEEDSRVADAFIQRFLLEKAEDRAAYAHYSQRRDGTDRSRGFSQEEALYDKLFSKINELVNQSARTFTCCYANSQAGEQQLIDQINKDPQQDQSEWKDSKGRVYFVGHESSGAARVWPGAIKILGQLWQGISYDQIEAGRPEQEGKPNIYSLAGYEARLKGSIAIGPEAKAEWMASREREQQRAIG